jgi:carboxylate-amine ligase
MELDFADSGRSTLGIEWELALVDPSSGELTPAAPRVLAAVAQPDGSENPHITGELLTNTVEIVTGVHTTVPDALDDLSRTIRIVRAATEALGVDLLCAGTHPFSQWYDQEVTDKERYATLIDRTQWWGRQLMIWGVHVHVGIEDRRKVIPILNGLLTYAPHFQALSASSPFWAGETTGYASSRAMLFQQLPTSGLPPQFDDWTEYERMVEDMLRVGVIDEPSELRWDIRPSSKWGTIEMRVCDGLATLREVGAIAALTQCLVEEFSRMLDRGDAIPTLPGWYLRENKWRAGRYGMDAIIIRDAAGAECLVTEDLDRMIDRLQPIARELGCTDQLRDVRTIIERGASYQRQLRVATTEPDGLTAVVRHLVQELRHDLT